MSDTIKSFEKELEYLINRRSLENDSSTPDFILALYLRACLDAYTKAVTERDRWFNFQPWGKKDVVE